MRDRGFQCLPDAALHQHRVTGRAAGLPAGGAEGSFDVDVPQAGVPPGRPRRVEDVGAGRCRPAHPEVRGEPQQVPGDVRVDAGEVAGDGAQRVRFGGDAGDQRRGDLHPHAGGTQPLDRVQHGTQVRAGEPSVSGLPRGLDVDVHRVQRARDQVDRGRGEKTVRLPHDRHARRGGEGREGQGQLRGETGLGVGHGEGRTVRGGLRDQLGGLRGPACPGDVGDLAVLGQPVVDAVVAAERASRPGDREHPAPRPDVVEGLALDRVKVRDCDGVGGCLQHTGVVAPHRAHSRLAGPQLTAMRTQQAADPPGLFAALIRLSGFAPNRLTENGRPPHRPMRIVRHGVFRTGAPGRGAGHGVPG